MDYLRVIRLGYGKGAPGEQACWMTALQAHMDGKWTDSCECVDPVINAVCIGINDLYLDDDAARTEDILNFGLFRVLGTHGSEEDMRRRMWHLVDTAVRRWIPMQLRNMGASAHAQWFATQPKISNPEEAQATISAMPNWKNYATPRYDAVNRCIGVAGVLDVARRGIYGPALASSYLLFSDVPDHARRNLIQTLMFPVLAELIELGPHGPTEMPEPACGIQEFHRRVGVK